MFGIFGMMHSPSIPGMRSNSIIVGQSPWSEQMCNLGLTARDILHLTPKFWEFHFDCTIARYAERRQDLQQLLDDLLSFNICGEFMLTEVSYGLDA
ncbi:hypothetical protein CKAH01_18841 [Colletotrichum kahawae]|uniref:Uncharacterized protein n=1 Tax=Colletotrichum kahawae TaxID=34407 RepID=A0AAD9Y627_COLKA|nr:hypothetical protein CKAH01_18841 [Colletotrichum kahawae]